MDKILITGANGYLGACVFDDFSSTKNKSVIKFQGRLQDIEPKSLDFDLVIHCAGALRYRKGEHSISNAEGTKKLINGLKNKAKIIYISSKSIYGTKSEGYLTEQTMPKPDDDYGISKYEGELAVVESGFPYIILRSGTLFGIGINNPGTAFPYLAMQKLFNGNNVAIFTPDVVEEYLYVKDLAAIVLKLSERDTDWNTILNVSGRKQSLFELVDMIEQQLKAKNLIIGEVKKTYKPPSNKFYLDCSKLEQFLDYNYLTSSDLVISEMIEFIRK
jgi:dTDP-4-dehydrorhamnose reductase